MDNINPESVIRQLSSLLPIDSNERFFSDRYTKKLTTMKAIQIFIAAQVKQCSSFKQMEIALRAQDPLRELVQIETISGPQLSRKLDQIPTELLEWIFLEWASTIRKRHWIPLAQSHSLGKLHIIDSSTIRLPLQLGKWARMSRNKSGVKMHLRLLVQDPHTLLPDAMVPSTVNVDDRAGAVELVVDPDAIYVMDRGYDHYGRMDQWMEKGIQFVIRMRDRALATVIEEYEIPPESKVTRDAKVAVGGEFRSMEHPVRLVEFVDEQGRTYRIFTSVWDKSAEEIAEIYKARWLIELYFKWLKQHLNVRKLHSTKPQAIWNQLFLALITALLMDELRYRLETPKTNWEVLQLVREYLYLAWNAFEKEVNRKGTRKGKGRQPGSGPGSISIRTSVGMVKASRYNK